VKPVPAEEPPAEAESVNPVFDEKQTTLITIKNTDSQDHEMKSSEESKHEDDGIFDVQ
jgi:hypothetical protein